MADDVRGGWPHGDTGVRSRRAGSRASSRDDADHTVSIGWGGAGGQMVRFVPELDLAIAYVTNTLGSRMAMNDPRGLMLLDAAVACARRCPRRNG